MIQRNILYLNTEDFPKGFTLQTVPTEDPHEVDLIITPQNTAKKVTAKGFITTNHPGERYARIPLRLLIK